MKEIVIKNAYSNNLKNININIPRNKLIVITGPSGSGKSSLAFDTIFKEGQRRFLESLSSYGRSYLQSLERPKVDSIKGLSPAIAIDQKSTITNPRSTVGTVTEIYTYLRMLFAKLSVPHSPDSGNPIKPQDKSKIIKKILAFPLKSKVVILSPILQHKKGEHRNVLAKYESMGFSRIRVNGKFQYIDEPLKINKKSYNNIDLVIDRIVKKEDSKQRITNAITNALNFSKGSLVILKDEQEFFFSENYYCPIAQKSYPTLDESIFSFNSPKGYCPHCEGIGFSEVITEKSLFFDKSLSIEDGSISAFLAKEKVFSKFISNFFLENKKDIKTPIEKLSKSFYKKLVYGDNEFKGLLHFLNNFIKNKESLSSTSNALSHITTVKNCKYCNGYRLNPYALSATLEGKNIGEVSFLEISDFHNFIKKIKSKYKKHIVASKILKEIEERSNFLVDIGLYYLSLSRSASTLSGGEYQRIRLSTQLGSMMSGVVYILDEPSIGLHQRDNFKLIDALKKLKDLNNTVIVVEHDEETMRSADHIIDIGPESGKGGGYIVSEGSLRSILKSKDSLTAQYLSKKKEISVNLDPKKPEKFINLKGAFQNNLKNCNASFPLERFTCITGVSGSGKSTLIHEVLVPALKNKLWKGFPRRDNFTGISGTEFLNDIIQIDQSPIGRTPKSIPLTYCQIFNHIRNIFASTNEAKVKGFGPGHFSFNVKAGQCEGCEGSGYIKFEMPFLSNVLNTCPRCKTKRYNKEVLDITYRGKNIFEILDMTVTEAIDFFKNHKKIHHTLKTLLDVGLGYLKLGQPSPTLSGGEAQRIKLSRELSKIKKGKCIYILDEPTTGLHFNDIKLLLDSLHSLVSIGHTVIVIEHNLDVIKVADHIIDLGPDGGKNGGNIIGTGNIGEIIKNKKSLTGKFLKNHIKDSLS